MESGLRARPDNRSQGQPQPKVSCLRCREQKLKCSRELPSCGRCLKQTVDCTYPSPPDRRRIAQRVSEAKASRANADRPNQHRSKGSSDSSTRHPTHSGVHDPFDLVPDPHHDPDSIWESDVSEAADLPSTEVGLLLLEVYFKRVYNASLIFHKAIVFDLYRRNAIPSFLLRAIFAQAAIFLQKIDTSHKDQIKTVAMQTVFEMSWSWARSASKDVLSHADEPTLTRIQALEVLQLYYFSRGDVKRCKIHLHLAYKLAQLLEYPCLREEAASESNAQQSMFEREMKRRCFWAIWCSIALGDSFANFESIREEVQGLPLPAKIDSNSLTKRHSFSLGPRMVPDCEVDSELTHLNMGTSDSLSCSLMAKLIKCLNVWTGVKEFISELPTLSPAESASKFERLAGCADSTHRSSGFTVGNLCAHAKSNHESPELLVSVHSVHLLNQLMLHVSMVSKLVKMPPNLFETSHLAQRCSRATLEHAGAFSDLSQLLFEEKLDLSRLWPLLGFGAFIAASIFSVYNHEVLQSPPRYHSLHIPGPDSKEMKSIRTVMEVSGVYWRPLRKFTTKFKQALSARSFGDLDSVISSTYPWDAAYSEQVSGSPREITKSDDRSDTGSLQSQLSLPLPLSQHPSAQQSHSHLQAIGDANFQPTANEQSLLLHEPGNGEPYPDFIDFGFQAADQNLFPQPSDVDDVFEPDLWNTISMDISAEPCATGTSTALPEHRFR